jgi:endonuclease/exonuclease/phosphatase family metal-dependent hydrolase
MTKSCMNTTMNRTQKSNLSKWPKIVLPALTIMFGQQTLRALLPYLQYLLGDRFGWSPIQMGLVALLIFSTAFLTVWLNQRLGLRRMLLLSAGGLGLARLAAQLWSGDPLGDMALVMIGTILFVFFWPIYLALARSQNNATQAMYRFAQAILLGLIFDTALHGVFLTYDFIWQAGVIPLLLIIGLVSIQWAALQVPLATTPPHAAPREGTFLATLPWLSIGPFLFIQLVVFQNQARLATLTDWSLPVVFSWALISHIFGLGLATLWQPNKTGALVVGLLLVLTLWPLGATNPTVFALALLVGQISVAVLMATILRGLGENLAKEYEPAGTSGQPQKGLRNTTIVHALSMILMVILIFGFYVGFSLRVPFQNDWLLSFSGVTIALSGIGAAGMLTNLAKWQMPHPALALPFLLLLLPLFTFLTWCTPTPISPDRPLRLMDYNVHNGFDTNGHLGMEALAQVIETQQADIVTLQEVSRGWVVNGSLDMLSWLSQRLGLPYYAYTPSGDALVGQAVLSRYPLLLAEAHPLPPRDLPLKRSFAYLQIDIGQATPLNLINTHFHHRTTDSVIRLTQVKTILVFLTDRQLDHLILTGDLNATPDTPEIQLFYEHGLKDVIIEANLTPGYTVDSVQPDKRLDYILISPDLTASDVVIPHSTASDHLGIVATINLPK